MHAHHAFSFSHQPSLSRLSTLSRQSIASLIVLFWAICTAIAHSAEEARTIKIGVIEHQLKFDPSTFQVKPGERIKLEFHNHDELQHNLVLCKPEAKLPQKLTEAVLLLGAEGIEKEWIPDHPSILHHTKVVNVGETVVLEFTAPEKEGSYPYICTYPGHALVMHGNMLVSSLEPGLRELSSEYYEGKWSKLPDFSTLEPLWKRALPENQITTDISANQEHFAIRYQGKLQIPFSGWANFYLDSDDGSELFINGESLIANDGIHPVTKFQKARVNLEKGVHDFELHYFNAGGGKEIRLHWNAKGVSRSSLTDRDQELGAEIKPIKIAITQEAEVHRVFLPEASSRALAVGLPSGKHFVFDVETATVPYTWQGEFLDFGPDRTRRGGKVCPPLGKTVNTGSLDFPLRLGKKWQPTPAYTFQGYQTQAGGLPPVLHFELDDISVQQTVSPQKKAGALQYEILFPNHQGPVHFLFDPTQTEVSMTGAETHPVSENLARLTWQASKGNASLLTLRSLTPAPSSSPQP